MADATRPRRFDVTMSRRTRRAATVPVADCQQDQDMEMEGSQMNEVKPVAEQKPRQPFEEHIIPQQQWLDGDEKADQTQQQQGQDSRRLLSLKELIDEAVNGDREDAATGGRQGENAAAANDDDEVAEADAASATKQPEHVQGRGVIGIVRRYVRVRSIKANHAREMNAAPAR